MSEFRFAYPAAFLFLILLPMLSYLPVLRRLRAAHLMYANIQLVTGLSKSWRLRLYFVPNMLQVLGWILLVIALARPQTGQAEDIIRGQGIDIVLAVDISTSMAALDFQPRNRLETAKSVIADFIAGRSFDRIGLVVFARNAYHQAPLTLDYPILLRLLDEIVLASELRQTDGRRLDGTALGLGIASSANMLRNGDAPSKVIILLTDGANNAGLDPIQATRAAAAFGIRVYTIGMGRPGLVEYPDSNGDIQTIESDLDEEVLGEIAMLSNGLYFRAEDAGGLQQIYNQIDALERSDAERVIFIRWQDQAAAFLIFSLFFLIGETVLRQTVFRQLP